MLHAADFCQTGTLVVGFRLNPLENSEVNHPKRVLILSVENSGRSQIAEALWGAMGGSQWRVYSAGTNPASEVNPVAACVMNEVGVDLSAYRPKSISEFRNQAFDLLVTLDDDALEMCSSYPDAKCHLHWQIPHPARMSSSNEEQMIQFRCARESIREGIAKCMAKRKPSVLFLSVNNAGRSQIAEGILRQLAGERFDVYSAGTRPSKICKRAIDVMGDVGIDISKQRAKSECDFIGKSEIDLSIVVCQKSESFCPTAWPYSREMWYWPFDDPREEWWINRCLITVRDRYCLVRDEMMETISRWVDQLKSCAESEITPSNGTFKFVDGTRARLRIGHVGPATST